MLMNNIQNNQILIKKDYSEPIFGFNTFKQCNEFFDYQVVAPKIRELNLFELTKKEVTGNYKNILSNLKKEHDGLKIFNNTTLEEITTVNDVISRVIIKTYIENHCKLAALTYNFFMRFRNSINGLFLLSVRDLEYLKDLGLHFISAQVMDPDMDLNWVLVDESNLNYLKLMDHKETGEVIRWIIDIDAINRDIKEIENFA